MFSAKSFYDINTINMLCMSIQQAQVLHDPCWAAVTKQQGDRNKQGQKSLITHAAPMSMILAFSLKVNKSSESGEMNEILQLCCSSGEEEDVNIWR